MTPDRAHRAHVLRFASPAARPALTALWTIGDEIQSSARADLDHTVAHARLAWWQEECARTARGAAAHPLTTLVSRSVHERASVWPQLDGLVRAAALDLAHAPLSTPADRHDYAAASFGTMFAAMAQMFGAQPGESSTAREIGTQLGLAGLASQGADLADAEQSVAAAVELRLALTRLPPAAQPGLRPLLVWVALLDAQRRSAPRRDVTTTQASLRHELAGAVRAWRAAVAAERGRFHLPSLRP